MTDDLTTRHMVGQFTDGIWQSLWCSFRNLHKFPDVSLLIGVPDGGSFTSTRVQVKNLALLPDDCRILAQDGVEGGDWNTTGYVSGERFKRHYLGEIGTIKMADAAPAVAPDDTEYDHGIGADGNKFWACTNETLQLQATWTGDAPASELTYGWSVTSGQSHCRIVSGQQSQTVTVEFTGGGGITCALWCFVRHKWNQDIRDEQTTAYLLGVNEYPWVASIDQQIGEFQS